MDSLDGKQIQNQFNWFVSLQFSNNCLLNIKMISAAKVRFQVDYFSFVLIFHLPLNQPSNLFTTLDFFSKSQINYITKNTFLIK